MPSINLAPGTQYVITARKRRVRIYTIAVAIIAIFVLGWFGLYMYIRIITASSTGVKNDIAIVDQKIQSLHDDAQRVAFFEKRLTDVSHLLDNHIGWDSVFADMERLLPPGTILTSFDAASQNSTITIEGTTLDIDQIALALASLEQGTNHPSVFTKGTIKKIQRQDKKNGEVTIPIYTFAMTLEFNKSVLAKTAL